MHNFSKLTIAALAALALSGTPSFAQGQSNAAIVAECATPGVAAGSCAALVRSKVDALLEADVSDEVLNSELIDLVAGLAEAGQTAQADVLLEIIAGIRVAQAALTNPDLAAQVASIITALETGQPFQTAALGDEASPN